MSRSTRSDKWIPSETQIKEAGRMHGIGMTKKDIAHVFGVSYETFKNRVKEIPELSLSLERGTAEAKGTVMSTAYKMAVSGKQPAMTMFWLKTRCGWSETDAEVPEKESYRRPATLRLVNE